MHATVIIFEISITTINTDYSSIYVSNRALVTNLSVLRLLQSDP